MFCVRPIFSHLRFRQMQTGLVPLQRVLNFNQFNTHRNFSLATEEDESGKRILIINVVFTKLLKPTY